LRCQWPLLTLPRIAEALADYANRQVNALIPNTTTLNISTVELVGRLPETLLVTLELLCGQPAEPGAVAGAMRREP
jgi:hypothetical protein